MKGKNARLLRRLSQFKPHEQRHYHQFNNSHNYSSNMLGGCLGTYFGCCGDNVTFCMNMNCTNCMNNTVY